MPDNGAPDRDDLRAMLENGAPQTGKSVSITEAMHAQYAGQTALRVLTLSAVARAILTVVYGASAAAVVWLFLLQQLDATQAAVAFTLFGLLTYITLPEPKGEKRANTKGTDRNA